MPWREKYADYDRKVVFGENPYFRFFNKFKKTYPVMQQFESVMFKGRPFPEEGLIMGVPSCWELTTFVLSGTHDIDRMDGSVDHLYAKRKVAVPWVCAPQARTYTYRRTSVDAIARVSFSA